MTLDEWKKLPLLLRQNQALVVLGCSKTKMRVMIEDKALDVVWDGKQRKFRKSQLAALVRLPL